MFGSVHFHLCPYYCCIKREDIREELVTFWCREICYKDATATIRIRLKFPYTKVLASTEESLGNDMGISHSAGDTCSLQLAPDAEARMGLDWGSNCS